MGLGQPGRSHRERTLKVVCLDEHDANRLSLRRRGVLVLRLAVPPPAERFRPEVVSGAHDLAGTANGASAGRQLGHFRERLATSVGLV